MLTDEEKARQVTAKLAGEFYIGARVRITQHRFVSASFGKLATVVSITKSGLLELSPPPPHGPWWHPDNVELI